MIKDKSLRNAELGNVALFREHNVSQVSDKTLPACKKPGRKKTGKSNFSILFIICVTD